MFTYVPGIFNTTAIRNQELLAVAPERSGRVKPLRRIKGESV